MLVDLLEMSHNGTSDKDCVTCQRWDVWYDFAKHNRENVFVFDK